VLAGPDIQALDRAFQILLGFLSAIARLIEERIVHGSSALSANTTSYRRVRVSAPWTQGVHIQCRRRIAEYCFLFVSSYAF